MELPAARLGALRGGEHSMGHRFGCSLDGAEQGFPSGSWAEARASGASRGAQPSPWAPTTSQGDKRGWQGPASREASRPRAQPGFEGLLAGQGGEESLRATRTGQGA